MMYIKFFYRIFFGTKMTIINLHSKINHFEMACHPDTSGQPLSREEGELHALHFTDEVVLHATTGFSVADFSKDEQANLFQNTCLC